MTAKNILTILKRLINSPVIPFYGSPSYRFCTRLNPIFICTLNAIYGKLLGNHLSGLT